MTSRWITSAAEFAMLAPAWDTALGASDSGNPFLLSDFLLPWIECLVPAGALRVLVIEDGSDLVAGWPLYRARRRGVATLRMIGLGVANWTEPFSLRPASEFASAAAVALRRLRGWRYLTMPLLRARWLALGGQFRAVSRVAFENVRLRLDLPAEEHLATLRPRMQANVRRCLRHAAAAGRVTLQRESASAAIESLIAFQLRHNGPQRYPRDTVVTGSRARWSDFTHRLLLRLHAAGRLDAMALRLDGQLAAAGFGVRLDHGYHSLFISHDPTRNAWGPGFVFFHQLVDWCRTRGYRYIEMYGDPPTHEKRRWGNQFEPLYELRLFPSGLAGRALWAAATTRS